MAAAPQGHGAGHSQSLASLVHMLASDVRELRATVVGLADTNAQLQAKVADLEEGSATQRQQWCRCTASVADLEAAVAQLAPAGAAPAPATPSGGGGGGGGKRKRPAGSAGKRSASGGGGGAFRGTKRDFLAFPEALAYVRSLKLGSHSEYKLWSKSGKRPTCALSTELGAAFLIPLALPRARTPCGLTRV